MPGVFKVWQGYAEKANPSRRYRYATEYNRTFSRLTWSDTTFDMNDPTVTGYYVPIERFAVLREYGSQEFSNIDLLMQHATKVGAIDGKLPLIGVSEADMKKVNTAHWSNLFDVVDAYVNQEMTSGLCDDLARIQFNSDVDGSSTVKDAWQYVGPLVNTSDLKTFLDQLFVSKKAPNPAWRELFTVISTSAQQKISTIVEAQRTEYRELGAKYDVFQLINWNRCSHAHYAAIAAKYINVCIASLTLP
jgi:hypothetical protein